MMSSVHLECSSRTSAPHFRQVTGADQVRTSVKSSHSPTSLGTYRTVYPQKTFLRVCGAVLAATDPPQVRRQVRSQDIVLPRMALARRRK
jgi:hypothetical protein